VRRDRLSTRLSLATSVNGAFLSMSSPVVRPPAPIPQGVADHFWEQAAARRALEAELLTIFRSWGYADVLPPAIEYAETLNSRANPELQAEIYRFADRDGRMLALRADMTIPVARLVATRLHDVPMPQRFCYAGSVFRYGETRAGRQREFQQAGIELIGAAQAAADAEVMALTVRAIESAGVQDVTLALGHIGYFHALLDSLALPPDATAHLFDAVDRNSDAALAAFLAQTSLGSEQRNVLAQLPHLSGADQAAILSLAERLCLNDGMSSALANLREVLAALQGHGLEEQIFLDLTEVHNLGYYSGVTFEALTPRLGFALASGGRYDHLVGTFGAPQPAVGAALTLDRLLLAATPAAGPAAPLAPDLLVQTHGVRAAALAIDALRAEGRRVALELEGASGAALVEAARRQGIGAVAEWVEGALVQTVVARAPGSAERPAAESARLQEARHGR
jgi:ATP phosphoribosyltransferase regulatory subunit